MIANDDELQEETATTAGTVGTRWLRRTYPLTRRTLPVMRQLHFVAAVYSRHGALAGRQPLIQQVQERRLAAIPPAAPPLPWPSLSPAPASSATQPLRTLDQTQPVAPGERWGDPPATGLEGRQDRLYRSSQALQTEEAVSPSTKPPAEEVATLPASVAHSPSFQLGPHVRSYLARALNIRIPAVRIYANLAADRVARQQRADAVTYGRNLLFRAGKYNPATRQGLALLGHELTHVAKGETAYAVADGTAMPHHLVQEEYTALQNEQQVLNRLAGSTATPVTTTIQPAPATVHRPRTAAAMPYHLAQEEYTALQNEQQVLNRLAGPSAAPVATAIQPAPATVHTSRTAAADRAVNDPGGRNAVPAPVALTAAQLQLIKDAVYRDLMERIRTEFERGG